MNGFQQPRTDCRHRAGRITAVLFLSLATPGSAAGDDRSPSSVVLPPEEIRFDPDLFHRGLQQRGLTDFLELHLRDFPPANTGHALLMMREVRLSEFRDTTKSAEVRYQAIHVANQLLERAIAGLQDDPRRFEWRYALAHSLIYEEGEPYATSILYRGGCRRHRQRLRELTSRAMETIDSLEGDIAREFARIDALPAHEFDKLENAGHVDTLDRLGPRAEYLLHWCTFFDALGRDVHDPLYAARLHAVMKTFEQKMFLLAETGKPSASLAEYNLLAGMTQRRLRDHAAARRHLERAAAVDEQLAGASGKSLTWISTLATIEAVRNEAEEGRFEQALERLKAYRARLGTQAADFDMRVSLALTERYVHRLHAASADSLSRRAEARHLRERSWQPVAEILVDQPQRKAELYAVLYELVEPDDPPMRLDAIEQCAVIARCLHQAELDSDASASLLQRAADTGVFFLEAHSDSAKLQVPEVLFNLAVTRQRQGEIAEAAAYFHRVAREHRTQPYAVQAAALAVQLAHDALEEVYADDAKRKAVASLYTDALTTLQTVYPISEAAKRWQFHYGVWLHDAGRYEAAITTLNAIPEQHEFYLDSLFYRAQCLARLMQELAPRHTTDYVRIHQLAEDFRKADAEFNRLSRDRSTSEAYADQAARREYMHARLAILGAGNWLLPQFNRPETALERLENFERDYPGQASLVAQLWSVRLLAYEKLDRLTEAAASIPAFVSADPDNAGPVLQSLYARIADQVDRVRTDADSSAEQPKAELALLLANQIAKWAERKGSELSPQQQADIKTQLAQANLRAKQYATARELFDSLVASLPSGGRETPPIAWQWGLAESAYQLKDYAAALPRFNQLAMNLPPTDPVRWKSLLRDLQCRTVLRHPKEGILRVIQQQRLLHPDLGGPALAAQFDLLERENQRR